MNVLTVSTKNNMNITLSIIIPAYNEERRIKKTLIYISDFLRLNKISFEIIVVANNCNDGTVALLSQIKSDSIPEIVIIDIPREGIVGNMKGYAISVGMKKATGRYHIFIDADNATSFESVISFMKLVDIGYDVVIGSRYVVGSDVVRKQPFYRVLLSRMSNLLIRLVLLPRIYDTQCGFKMFSQKSSKEIFSQVTVPGWGADMEMLAIAQTLGYKISEAPIRWEAQDESTVRAHAFIQTLKELFAIRRNILMRRYKHIK